MEPSLDMSNNSSLDLVSGIISFRDKVYLRNNSFLYLLINPGHTLKITDSTYLGVNADGDNEYEVTIRFIFGTYSFEIENIRINNELGESDIGIVYFGGDIKKGNNNNFDIFDVGGKYYFYKDGTEVHKALTEIDEGNLVEILNPELLKEIFDIGSGIPSIEYTIWGDN